MGQAYRLLGVFNALRNFPKSATNDRENCAMQIHLAYHGKYTSPSNLANDQSLDRNEKIEMLKQWRDDKKAILRASDEGMEGDDPSEVLRKIKKELAALEEAFSE